MWVGLGLLKEKEACEPGVTAAKRRRLLSQVCLLCDSIVPSVLDVLLLLLLGLVVDVAVVDGLRLICFALFPRGYHTAAVPGHQFTSTFLSHGPT